MVDTTTNVQSVLRLLAEQAAHRAARREVSLPVLAQLGSAALTAELEMWAGENEAVLQALGVDRASVLRGIAGWVPGALLTASRGVIASDRAAAFVLGVFAGEKPAGE